jgi:hypothetical protein
VPGTLLECMVENGSKDMPGSTGFLGITAVCMLANGSKDVPGSEFLGIKVTSSLSTST